MANSQNTAISTDSNFMIISAKFLLDLMSQKELATCYKIMTSVQHTKYRSRKAVTSCRPTSLKNLVV